VFTGAKILAYRLKRKETLDDGVRRIAKQQISRANGELGDDALGAAEKVHQVRKRLKKLRALLRLVRDDIGKSAYRAENKRLRNLGRRLSAARDAQVMLDTAIALAGDHPELATNGFDVLRSHLRQRCEVKTPNEQAAIDRLADISGELARIERRVDNWSIGGGDVSRLPTGLYRAYRKGRKSLKNLDDDSTDEALHEWRKRVKDYWYHFRLLASLWPAVMTCHVDELKKLSELLGDYHDFAVFQVMLADLPKEVLPDAARESWCRKVDAEKALLRRNAERLAAKLYIEKPKHFERRLQGLWKTWKRLH
jgi:CHAD domain-containing protein